MGYYEYFLQLLQPLRLYQLEEGAGAEELRVAGQALDGLTSALEETERESNPVTAESYGLSALEELLPYIPAYESLESRRAALAALLRIDGRCFTLSALQETLSGCGIHATVRESGDHYTVEVSFPDTMGEPAEFERLKPRIEAILPCHLQIRYALRFLLWRELENTLPSWAALETGVKSWRELETWRV